MSTGNPAVEAIKFAVERLIFLEVQDFLTAWLHGDWDDIRRDWPECPEECFVKPEVPHEG